MAIKLDHNKRDIEYSARHRLYGSKCYMSDLDCIEVDGQGRPVALIEVKHANANLLEFGGSFVFGALKKLASMAGLPLFLVQRAADFSRFDVYPQNDEARQFVPAPKKFLEREYITLLYKLRSLPAPLKDIAALEKIHWPTYCEQNNIPRWDVKKD